jgi:CubicO group peptidase (beta-lactamase class C family)
MCGRDGERPSESSFEQVIETQVGGSVDARFQAVRAAFAENFEKHNEDGAACCVYVDGKPVVDIWGGTYRDDTLQLVFSTTKGIAAIAAHMLAEEGRLDFDAPVVEYWPEFGAEGKERIPVRWLFCHKAGLAAIDRPIVLDDVLLWTPAVQALAAQRPLWEPGSAHGYHTLTYGWLAGEVIRRITGTTVGAFVAERIAGPLRAEFWIGLPEGEESRVTPVIPPAPPGPGAELDPFTRRLMDPTSITARSFGAFPPAAWNERPVHAAEQPAGSGIGTARALARIYAACIGEVDGVRLLRSDTVGAAATTQARGSDLTMTYETHFGTGFALPSPFRPMAGDGSFGHYGSGGSVGFANSRLGVSFGYTMNQMRPVWGADPRTRALVEALLACL